MLPFFKPGYCCIRRDSKAAPKAEMCFYLNGGSNHPSLLLKSSSRPARSFTPATSHGFILGSHSRYPSRPGGEDLLASIFWNRDRRRRRRRSSSSSSGHHLHHCCYHSGNCRLCRRRRHRRNALLASCATTCLVRGTATSGNQGRQVVAQLVSNALRRWQWRRRRRGLPLW